MPSNVNVFSGFKSIALQNTLLHAKWNAKNTLNDLSHTLLTNALLDHLFLEYSILPCLYFLVQIKSLHCQWNPYHIHSRQMPFPCHVLWHYINSFNSNQAKPSHQKAIYSAIKLNQLFSFSWLQNTHNKPLRSHSAQAVSQE